MDPIVTQLLNQYLKGTGYSMTDIKSLNINKPDFRFIHQLECIYQQSKNLPLTLAEKKLFDKIDLYKPRLGEEEGEFPFKRREKKLPDLDGKGNISIILYDSELEHIYRRILENGD